MGTDATGARFPAMAAGYESYYLRAVAPEGGRGFWLRHTVRVARGEDPSGSLWFTWFDESGPTATKLTVPGPLAGGATGGPWIEVGGATIGANHAAGAIAEAPGRPPAWWDLTFHGEAPLWHLAKDWLYSSPLPRTKPVSIHPTARFSGTVSLGEQSVDVTEWPGMVGHNWGSQHAERWIWLHGNGLGHGEGPAGDDWLDVVLGRIRVGPVLLPWVASGAVSLGGRRHVLGGPARARSTRVAERPDGAHLSIAGADGVAVRVDVGAPRERFVGWVYADPDGRTHDVVNCSVSDLELVVSRPGQPDVRLTAAGTAAYELGMRERGHGMQIQPFPDAPAGARRR